MATTQTSSAVLTTPAASAAPATPWLMLLSRSAYFFFFQAVIGLIVWLSGAADPWTEAARWWTSIATLANLSSIALLSVLLRREGSSLLQLLRFSRQTFKGDLLWFVAVSILGMPVAALPMTFLPGLLFADPMTPTEMLFQPLPAWGFAIAFLFPITIGFAELPTYFGYVMPRLTKQLNNDWLAYVLASLGLALQHAFLPLLFDGSFILYRALMYLPFAFFAGLVIKLRPSLLPWMCAVHILIDISAVMVYLML